MSIVVAEAGTAHLGNLGKALSLVSGAASAGAQIVKFQMFSAPVTRESMSWCWIEGDTTRRDRWEQSALSLEEWKVVRAMAENHGMGLVGSVFQDSTLHWAEELGMPFVKVASRCAKKFPYDSLAVPPVISLGMEPPDNAPDNARFMQCESNYPSTRWWERSSLGFSDHSGSPWRAIDALARGCPMVEVHFYTDEADAGPDLTASVTVQELEMIGRARAAFLEKHGWAGAHGRNLPQAIQCG